jgi:hypothetical protein
MPNLGIDDHKLPNQAIEWAEDQIFPFTRQVGNWFF